MTTVSDNTRRERLGTEQIARQRARCAIMSASVEVAAVGALHAASTRAAAGGVPLRRCQRAAPRRPSTPDPPPRNRTPRAPARAGAAAALFGPALQR